MFSLHLKTFFFLCVWLDLHFMGMYKLLSHILYLTSASCYLVHIVCQPHIVPIIASSGLSLNKGHNNLKHSSFRNQTQWTGFLADILPKQETCKCVNDNSIPLRGRYAVGPCQGY